MMRALYSGISGLQGHQASMDVIGNNIANVNTVGFKSSRMTFSEAMSQTLSFGKAPDGINGGSNPKQIGIGMSIGSIDTNFGQGILTTTNMVTDLALEGEGFFIVNDGNQNMYTRAGAFQLDAEGNLLAQGGKYHVQGKMANSNGEISSGGTIGNIKLPFGQKSPASATTEIKYHCNLDASADALANIYSADYSQAAATEGGVITGDPLATPPTTGFESVVGGNTFTVSLNGTAAETVTIPAGTEAPTNTSELISTMNQAIRENANLAGNVEVVANPANKAFIQGGNVDSAGYAAVITAGSFDITLNGSVAETVNIPAGAATPTNTTELISLLNQSISANTNLAGKVEAVSNFAGDGVIFQTIDTGSNISLEISAGAMATALNLPATLTANGSGGGIVFQTIEKGGADVSITVTGETVDFGTTGLNITNTSGKGTDVTTALNDLPMITSDLTTGDTITISGTNPDGTQITSTLTYDASANGGSGSNVQNLIDTINSAFTGATATLNNKGEIVITDAVTGVSSTTVSISFSDNDRGANPDAISAVSIPSFALSQKGVNAGEHTASIYSYDSLGNKHTIEMTFVKNEGQDNYWNWEVSVDGGDTEITAGNSGYVTFNNDGSIATMESSDGKMLSFNPGGGASTMEIDLNGGESGSFSGITQYDSPFTTIAYEQDGYTMGILDNIYFDETGTIFGEYTNGQNQKLAQLSLATFTNENGLLKDGGNFYKASTNSGQAEIGLAGKNSNTAIRSGYLENSNVDLSKELTDMIVIQRGYQANTKTINTADTLLQELIQKVKR